MVAGFVVGFLTSVPNPWLNLQIVDFGMRLIVTAGITLAIWVPVMLLTKPESEQKLESFYRRVRPGGPGWRRQRRRTGLAPRQELGKDIQRVFAGLMILFGLMFAVGGAVLLRWLTMVVMTLIAAVGYLWLRRIGEHREGRLDAEIAARV